MKLTHIMAICWLDKARAHSLVKYVGFTLSLTKTNAKICYRSHFVMHLNSVNGKIKIVVATSPNNRATTYAT